jgi:hypothetical protein
VCSQAVEPLQDSLIEQQQLTRLDSATLQQFVSSSSSSSSTAGGGSGDDGAGTQADGSCSNVAKQLAAVSLNGNAEQDSAQQSEHLQQQQQQQQCQVPCVRVTANTGGSSDEDGSMQLVSKLGSSAGSVFAAGCCRQIQADMTAA